jgi:hypothetical protein
MVDVKFCGNCNPDVHPREVRRRLDEVLSRVEPGTEVLVNGCPRVCLVKDRALPFSSRRIAVYAREVAAGQLVPLPMPDPAEKVGKTCNTESRE